MDLDLNIKEENNLQGAIYQKICSSCNSPAKFCCPKCSTFSCSLDCINAHKVAQSCDGIRNEAEFVPATVFHEKHLLSDYRFLEEATRKIDNANRDQRNYGSLFFKPINLDRLRKNAFSRKTKLEILPILFARRKMNTSYLRYNDNKIFWRIEWIFPLCNSTFIDERIDEETLLGECLDKYLIPENSEINDERMSYYQSMGHKGVAVLMKNENTTSNDIKYYILKQNKSLRINFRHKRIIEFPTFLVVPKIHLSAYNIIE